MFSLCKGLWRVGTIGLVTAGVVTGGTLLIAGPQRTKAVFDKLQGGIIERIDEAIDDPTALRAQLQELEREYPARIKAVRGDLAELTEQVRQLERERAICERVVELASADLSALEPSIDEAAAVQASHTGARGAVVQFDDKLYSVPRAKAKAKQIRQTLVAYTNRAADAAHDLTYLSQQTARLEEFLGRLETERAEFQAQIWQLSRQVDAVARNDRLIGMLEKRNRTIEQCSRYDCSSLDQITSRLAQIRTRQEAELEQLSNGSERGDYEDLARMQLQGAVTIEAEAEPAEQLAGARVLERYGD